MSGAANNHHSWIVGNFYPRDDYTVHAPGNRDRHQTPAAVFQPFPYQATELIQDVENPWWLFQERLRTGPYDSPRFPWQPHFPAHILVQDDETSQAMNHRLRQFIEQSGPRIRDHQWNTQATQREESRLTPDEQKKALKKLKKQVYNPNPPSKSKNKKWCLFSRDCSNNIKKDDQIEDKKGCAICLEDFVTKQEVLVTPCNHMFHNDCIVPWVKNQGLCPVCRFLFVERSREHNSGSNVELNDLMSDDLISLVRAIEEAIEWTNSRH
ncbi:zinc finger protein [Macleaya cordata]|uniref:Zinc finger protein n=1 Tax=Macleaya cordata TaxID=56857 RepID=A0A200Q0T2_MACCD|nr:zinc finger protein [Macleaya cordata]